MKIYKNKNNIYSFLNYKECLGRNGSEAFIDCLFQGVDVHDLGCAGFRDKKTFFKHLVLRISGDNKGTFSSEENIINEVRSSMIKIKEKLHSEKSLDIFLFPTFSSFVKEEMLGVDGFTPYEYTIHLYLSPGCSMGEVSFALAHEYNHAVRFSYFPPYEYKTLRDRLVNEGLAELFKEDVFGGKSPWVTAVSEGEARKLLKENKGVLGSTKQAVINEIFGGGEWSLWAGYAMGYYLVRDYLDGRSWEEVIKLNSIEFIN